MYARLNGAVSGSCVKWRLRGIEAASLEASMKLNSLVAIEM